MASTTRRRSRQPTSASRWCVRPCSVGVCRCAAPAPAPLRPPPAPSGHHGHGRVQGGGQDRALGRQLRDHRAGRARGPPCVGQPAQGEGWGEDALLARGPQSAPSPSPPAQVFLYSLPTNFSQGLCVFFAFVLGLKEAPLTPIQVRQQRRRPSTSSTSACMPLIHMPLLLGRSRLRLPPPPRSSTST